MELKAFLDSVPDRSWWQQQAVICFLSEGDYPLLFFSTLIEQLRTITGSVLMPNVQDAEQLAIIRASCESSFLGSKTFHWFKNLDLLDVKRRTQWVDYLMRYQGPNCLLFYVRQLPHNGMVHGEQVVLSDLSTSLELQRLLLFLGVSDEKVRFALVSGLLKRSRKISLDTVCVVARYVRTMASDVEKYLSRILDTILLPEKSLFNLSGYLLASNGNDFFRAWAAIAYDFPELFWISYFSDVLWRAYFFARLMHAGNIVNAKQIANRLPFSFIQRDWRSVKLHKLHEAINMLYLLDRDLKNGATSGYATLDLTFAKMF